MKLYVGNLPFEARDEELRDLFAAHGTISKASVVVDHQRDRSRGFGFVEFDDPAQGKAAIAALHGFQLGGRSIVVNEARAQAGGRAVAAVAAATVAAAAVATTVSAVPAAAVVASRRAGRQDRRPCSRGSRGRGGACLRPGSTFGARHEGGGRQAAPCPRDSAPDGRLGRRRGGS